MTLRPDWDTLRFQVMEREVQVKVSDPELAEMLRAFGTGMERLRPAPEYDFAAPPAPGTLNYEHWGWEMTGARWRALAGAAGMRCVA